MTPYYEVRFIDSNATVNSKRFSVYEEASIYLIDTIFENMWTEGFYWNSINANTVSVSSNLATYTIQFEGPFVDAYHVDLECRLKAIHEWWITNNL